MPFVLGLEIPDELLARTAGTGFAGLPELLDAAGAGYVLLGADRTRSTGASLNPVLAGTIFARRTVGLGIVAAAAPQRDHPFNIARRIASLDHISGGRAGWLAARTDRATALGASARGVWASGDGPAGAGLLADAVTAARALWRTWPIESLTRETAAAQRPPDVEVRYADHTGVFPTTGPLNVPTTPQGEPVVWWDHETSDGDHLGAADIAVVAPGGLAVPVPPTVTRHVRLRDDAHLRARIEELAHAEPGVTGVLVRIDPVELPHFLRRVLPGLAESGLVRLRPPLDARATTPTLRDHLGIARRPEPDPLGFRPVYLPA